MSGGRGRQAAELYLLFMRIGAVTFGGGLAMLPMIRRELIERRGWVTEEEVAEYYAIGVCTPGVQAINISTLVGEMRAGVTGGIAATLGFVTAPTLCILLIAGVLSMLSGNVVYQAALKGIRAFVCVIIVDAVVRLWRTSVKGGFALLVFLITVGLRIFFRWSGRSVSSIIFVVCALAIGVYRGMRTEKEVRG